MMSHDFSILRSACSVICAAVLLAGVLGCGRRSQVPVGEPAENLRKLALGYVQFAAGNRGVGPADRESFQDFIVRTNQMTEEQADTFFVSPRDNQPYVIQWGLRPAGSQPIGPDPPQAPIIIYEARGTGRTRYVVDGRLSILELTPEEFEKAVNR
jgi:hypothetical protein